MLNVWIKEFNKKRERVLINNNCDPKDYLFFEELEKMIVFYHVYFKNLWALKKGLTLTSY